MIRVAKNKSAFAMLALVLLAGASASTVNADVAIERGFTTVIAQGEGGAQGEVRAQDADLPATSATVAPANTVVNIVSGSEDYWLRAPANANGSVPASIERVVWYGPVAAGGTLVIGSGSTRKELEVISIEPAAHQSATRIDMTMGSPAPLRVQARDGQNITAPALWLELTHQDSNTAAAAVTLPVGHAL